MMIQHQTHSETASNHLRPARGASHIRIWLLVVAAMVYAMILVGGATRLTDSGLSITEWKPITGALPPMGADDWASEFSKYQAQTAEYRFQNSGMTLSEFKQIYWWEWGHRLLGRLVGLVFLLPFLAFWALGWTTPRLRRRLWLLFGLGGFQGFIGWWMVSSGVGDTTRIDVAPYRLMTHFSLALLIVALCVWFWLSLGQKVRSAVDRRTRFWAIALLALAALQMMLGALVAGMDAGRSYTDWPLMNGAFFPAAYWEPALGLRNFFENPACAQFNHRMTAYILLAASLVAGGLFRGRAGGGFVVFAMLALLQTMLGIWTLVSAAPLDLGLLHQALGAILLLAGVTLVWRTQASSRG